MQPRTLTPRAVLTMVVGLVVLTSLSVWRLGFTGGDPGSLFETHGETMGTVYTVKAVGVAEGVDRIASGIEDALSSVDGKMSTYRGDSELSRFNAWRAREPFAMSAETLGVMARALEVSRKSGGAYDVTIGPLVNAWGFGPDGPSTEPSAEELRALLAHTGHALLTLDEDAGTAQKGTPDLYVDLSSIAKGHAVDRVALWLESRGIDDYMVEVGGEVRTAGRNAEGRAWQIGIRRPVTGADAVHDVVGLSGESMATSGDYQNFYERDGVRYSHIIDARTGRPVISSTASVTVIADDCATADAWATAFAVLGPDEGIAIADEHDIAVLFVLRDEDEFVERASSAYDARR